MDKQDVDRWLDAYVAAWETYDPEQIGALFSEDVEYRYHPYDVPVRGREALIAAWRGESDNPDASQPDEPGTFTADYRTVAVDGDVAVATGATTYLKSPGGPVDKVYDNCYVMRFDAEGRCREFTEWYMQQPKPD
ncbi:MAG TPA: nuclear transport factor 2 family protein [Gaiellaceae bacterium]|nr:nuclear transport factor 2 family protein [Gaiellaceae bacterium]